jgi:hypothetical protein
MSSSRGVENSTHVLEHTGQMLGQAIGGGPDGAHDQPKENPFLVDLQEPIQSRGP